MARPAIGTRIPIGAVGNAQPEDVRADRTFSSEAGTGVQGAAPVKIAQIWTPGTADQVISAGQFLSGDQTIKGEPNFIEANFKKGVSFWGKIGTLVPLEIVAGETYRSPAPPGTWRTEDTASFEKYNRGIRINVGGVYRFTLDYFTGNVGFNAYVYLTKNGVKVGETLTLTGDPYPANRYIRVLHSGLICNAGDIIGLYARPHSASQGFVTVHDFWASFAIPGFTFPQNIKA